MQQLKVLQRPLRVYKARGAVGRFWRTADVLLPSSTAYSSQG